MDALIHFLSLRQQIVLVFLGLSIVVLPSTCLLALLSQTSIVFSLEEGPGVLIKALAVFSFRQINLTKVWNLVYFSCSCTQAFVTTNYLGLLF